MVNHKGVWTGNNPFSIITNYPSLFYYIPGDILITGFFVAFIVLPFTLYSFSGLFFDKKIYCVYTAFLWLLIIPRSFTVVYGQLIAQFLLTLFVYFWIEKRYCFAFLCAIPVPFGHGGSTYLLVVLCGWALVQFLIKNKWNKLTLLVIFLFPAIFINGRSWFVILFFAVVPLVKMLPQNPKILLYPLILLLVSSCVTDMYVYHEKFNSFYETFDAFLEFHKDEDAYCYYVDTLENDRSGPSRITMRGWYYYNVPVKECPIEHYIEAKRKEHELIYNNSIKKLEIYR
jgi:hypothetical protein